MLAIVRPFSPGEKVYLMAVGGRFRGTNEPSVGGYLVKDIGWYQTTLIPKDTRPTTVPNGFFLGANVINITRQTARVIIINVRVRYEDFENVPAMTSEMEAYLRAHAAVIQPPASAPFACICSDVKDDHAAIRVEAHSHVVKKGRVPRREPGDHARDLRHPQKARAPARRGRCRASCSSRPPNYTEE
jgi:hypothetical protein